MFIPKLSDVFLVSTSLYVGVEADIDLLLVMNVCNVPLLQSLYVDDGHHTLSMLSVIDPDLLRDSVLDRHCQQVPVVVEFRRAGISSQDR